MILQNFRTIPGQKALFFQIPGVFQDQGQKFSGLYEPCKSLPDIICHINPQIQFVDICCGHGMSLTVFIHCDLDLRSQFLKKCTTADRLFYLW